MEQVGPAAHCRQQAGAPSQGHAQGDGPLVHISPQGVLSIQLIHEPQGRERAHQAGVGGGVIADLEETTRVGGALLNANAAHVAELQLGHHLQARWGWAGVAGHTSQGWCTRETSRGTAGVRWDTGNAEASTDLAGLQAPPRRPCKLCLQGLTRIEQWACP